MGNWLINLFIKKEDRDKTDNPQVRNAYGTLGSITGICVNVLLAAVKFFVGIATASISVTADAINNLSDAGGSVMSFATVKLANKPVDREHPFGHGRMEYIGSLAIGALILVAGVKLLTDGISGIINPEAVAVSVLSIVLLTFSIFAKLWLWGFYAKIAKLINSGTLAAASQDSINDVIATSAVLVSMLLQYFFGWKLDGWFAVLVSVFVLKAGCEIIKETLDCLVGKLPDPETVQAIRTKLMSFDEIIGVHDIIVHDYGPGRIFATAHAEVDGEADIYMLHEAIDKAEITIERELNILMCIHMDPIDTHDSESEGLKLQIYKFLQSRDKALSLHDLRRVPGKKRTNIIFDCLVPAGFTETDKLRDDLSAFVKTIDPTYEIVVRFDTDYVK